jgi:AcrR family transcriptional regulator
MTGSAQRSRGRPPLPRDRIVDAAVHIVDVQGADALSMRTLAQQLNSGTATLYRHFANRSELIAEVVDRVFGEVDFDTEELIAAGWQQACKNVAHAMFGALRRHANVSRLLIEQVPVGPNAMLQRERLIALLLGSGFPPKLAARSYATLARYVLGFAIQLTGPETADRADLSKVFHGVNPEIFPATTRVADHLPVPLEDEFDFGLDLIIDGLTQQHDKRPGTRSKRVGSESSPRNDDSRDRQHHVDGDVRELPTAGVRGDGADHGDGKRAGRDWRQDRRDVD